MLDVISLQADSILARHAAEPKDSVVSQFLSEVRHSEKRLAGFKPPLPG